MTTFKAISILSLGFWISTSFAQVPGFGGPQMPGPGQMQGGGQMMGGGQMQLGGQVQMGGQGQCLPGPHGQIPMMQPQGAGMAYQPTMVGENPPVPTGCGMGRNDYSRIVNQGGAPMPMNDGGSHN